MKVGFSAAFKKAAVALLVFIVFVFVLAFIFSAPEKEVVVYVKVQYDGGWSGAIASGGKSWSWSGNGPKTERLERPKGVSVWIISANAQKMDSSTKPLTIQIVLEDGTVLSEATTTAPYGVAQVSTEVK